MLSLEDIKTVLRNIELNYFNRDVELIHNSLVALKIDAVERNNQELAKEIWCFQQILEVQQKYLEAFNSMKMEGYYKAWTLLEQAELALYFLKAHFLDINQYKLKFIETQIERFQSLYPYKVFFSTEILELEKKCSICKQVISIRKSCGHKVGEIYNGEQCLREVTNMKLLGIAIVESPVNKYSVPFIADPVESGKEDHYNYSVVRYLIEGLDSPFNGWSYEMSKRRHEHLGYLKTERNELCPCKSGKKYKKCCLIEAEKLRPHYTFHFSETPKHKDIKNIVYIDAKGVTEY